MTRSQRNLPVVLLAAAMLVAAVATLVVTRHATFYADTWELLVGRRNPSLDNLLKPHNEHLILFPVLIEEVLMRVFGNSSAVPETVVLIVFLLATAGLVYAYVERRLGAWAALFAAVLILFLGPAWETLLWPFEITFCGPILFGLAALLALEREDTRGDVFACVCLSVGLGFSSLGLPFIPAAIVAVFLGPRERWRGRAYVWAVPLLLFVVWYLGWGHDAESHLTLRNILASPQFVVDSVAVAVGALSGLGTEAGTLAVDQTWGRILLVLLAVALLAWFALRRPRPRLDRTFWPLLAAALVNWFLTAFNAFAGREPTASRYQYAGAIFVLLLLAALLRGARPSRNVLIVAGVLTAFAVGPNLIVLHDGAQVLEREAVYTRADTAALEIAAPEVEPEFALSAEVAGVGTLVNVGAGPYLEAVEEHGSPAYSEAELLAAPEFGRKQADIVLSRALPITSSIEPRAFASKGRGECTLVPADREAPAEVLIGPGETRIEAAGGPPVGLALRRFAGLEFGVPLATLDGDSTVRLEIPKDESKQPWVVRVEGEQQVRICS